MKKLRDRWLSDESGFTLPELLVTMLMMLTVMFALYSIFDMSIRVFSFGNDKVEAVENARLGLERMEREIRAAYPYSEGDDELLKTADPREIRFGNNTDNTPGVTIPTEEIVYTLSSSEPYTLLRRSPSNDIIADPVVEFVEEDGLTFTYLESGNPDALASTNSEIKIVRITLEIVVDESTQTLETDVYLRNSDNS